VTLHQREQARLAVTPTTREQARLAEALGVTATPVTLHQREQARLAEALGVMAEALGVTATPVTLHQREQARLAVTPSASRKLFSKLFFNVPRGDFRTSSKNRQQTTNYYEMDFFIQISADLL
jgi:hypothetical protein